MALSLQLNQIYQNLDSAVVLVTHGRANILSSTIEDQIFHLLTKLPKVWVSLFLACLVWVVSHILKLQRVAADFYLKRKKIFLKKCLYIPFFCITISQFLHWMLSWGSRSLSLVIQGQYNWGNQREWEQWRWWNNAFVMAGDQNNKK